ncbi:MAG: leucine-rich repeat protein [Chitinophagaceae bacterium]|nr:leucine-rich repeat protein [Chitinophagaceae bacterium]
MFFPITSSPLNKLVFPAFITIALFFMCSNAFSQIGIGVNPPDASAMLHVQDTAKGMLIPRMSAAQKNAISSPAEGLMIYQTNESTGFWYFTNGRWVPVSNGGKTAIVLRGDITNSEAQAKIVAEAGPSTQVIKIIECTNLTSVDLSMVSGSVTQLMIQNNSQLQNVTFGGITSIEDTFLISNCPQLTSISLPQLEKINAQLRVINSSLVSLSLPGLKKVTGSIIITDNSNLLSVSMPVLTNATTGYALSIQNNQKITSISMPALIKASSFNISSNRKLSTIDFASLVSTTNGMNFTQDSSLTAISFPSCTSIGALEMLNITFDTSLTSVSMPVLTTAGNLNFHKNVNLQSLSFPAFPYTQGGITVQFSALTSFSFPSLTHADGFGINNNPLLTMVDFPALTSLGSINGYQSISFNSLLTTITWPNLTSIRANEFYYFRGNRLPSSKVNEILAKLVVTHPTVSTIILTQVVAAPPTGQGVTDKATLVNWGNTVTTD